MDKGTLFLKTHLIVSDIHTLPGRSNERADWLGHLMLDLRPDVFINLGDSCDFESLCSYDKGKRSFHGRTYRADIDSHNDFQFRIFNPLRSCKRKLPTSYFFIGNHEHRIDRALDLSPELQGTIGYNDLKLDEHYDEVIHYNGNTPGIKEIDGIHYAHYFVSGIMGRPVGGVHPAYSLNVSQNRSCTAGHSHILDFNVRTNVDRSKTMSLVAGCFTGGNLDWAGSVNSLWWQGVILKHVYGNGEYDLTTISLQELEKEYSGVGSR